LLCSASQNQGQNDLAAVQVCVRTGWTAPAM